MRTGKPWSIGSGCPFIATASIALRSSVRAASGVPHVQPSCEVCSTASAPVLEPELGEQVRQPYAAPPGVADQRPADRVGHTVEGHPCLGDLPLHQVVVGQHDLAIDHPVDPQLPLVRVDGGRDQGGVDQVELLVRGAPRRDPVDAQRDPGRLHRRGDSRQPQQPSRLLDLAAALPQRPAGGGDPHGGHHHQAGADEEAAARRPGVGLLGRGGSALGRAERVGQDREAQHPGHEADEDRQQVAEPGLVLHRDRHAGQHREHPEQQHGQPPRTPGQPARPREEQPQDDEEDHDQERLVVVSEDLDRPFRHRTRGEPDDQLGDGDHGRLADGHHHRHEVARRQAGETRHQPRQPPGVPRGPHPLILPQA